MGSQDWPKSQDTLSSAGRGHSDDTEKKSTVKVVVDGPQMVAVLTLCETQL